MKRPPKSFIIIFCFFGAIIACYLASRLLIIQTVQVHGGTLIGLDELSGKPLFLINTATLTNDLLQKNPTIESISIQKNYPNILSITLERSRPVGLLAVSKGYFVLSGNGKVVAKERTKTQKLPTISIGQKFPFESYAVGKTVSNQEIVVSAYLLGQFAQNKIHIDTVEIRGFDVVVCKGAGHTYIFSASKDQAEQFADFLVVYRQFLVENKKYSSIDVRFEKPVVVFEK